MGLARQSFTRGGGHGHAAPGHFDVQPVATWHKVGGQVAGAVMWFWIFYRAYHDGKVVLGLEHPWDAHGDHSHDEHH